MIRQTCSFCVVFTQRSCVGWRHTASQKVRVCLFVRVNARSNLTLTNCASIVSSAPVRYRPVCKKYIYCIDLYRRRVTYFAINLMHISWRMLCCFGGLGIRLLLNTTIDSFLCLICVEFQRCIDGNDEIRRALVRSASNLIVYQSEQIQYQFAIGSKRRKKSSQTATQLFKHCFVLLCRLWRSSPR